MTDFEMTISAEVNFQHYLPNAPYPGDDFFYTLRGYFGYGDSKAFLEVLQYDPETNSFSADGKTWLPVPVKEVVPIDTTPTPPLQTHVTKNAVKWEKKMTPFGPMMVVGSASLEIEAGATTEEIVEAVEQFIDEMLPGYALVKAE